MPSSVAVAVPALSPVISPLDGGLPSAPFELVQGERAWRKFAAHELPVLNSMRSASRMELARLRERRGVEAEKQAAIIARLARTDAEIHFLEDQLEALADFLLEENP